MADVTGVSRGVWPWEAPRISGAMVAMRSRLGPESLAQWAAGTWSGPSWTRVSRSMGQWAVGASQGLSWTRVSRSMGRRRRRRMRRTNREVGAGVGGGRGRAEGAADLKPPPTEAVQAPAGEAPEAGPKTAARQSCQSHRRRRAAALTAHVGWSATTPSVTRAS